MRTLHSTLPRCKTSSPQAGSLSLEEASRHGLGHLTRVYGSVPVTAAQGAAELVRQQRIVLDNSRLGVPALVHEECLTGLTSFGATVYPTALAWGATFDADLVERMAAAIGRDMAALGVHQGLSPCSTWSVTTAGAGSRRRSARIPPGGDARISLRTRACRARASSPRSSTSPAIQRLELHVTTDRCRWDAANCSDVILPTFETAIREGGAGSVMNSYADVDGVPAGSASVVTDRGVARALGFHRHGRVRLLGRAVSRHHASGGGVDRRRRSARPRGRHRHRTAGHGRVRARTGRPRAQRRCRRGSGRPRGSPAADPEGGTRAARRGVDPGGLCAPSRADPDLDSADNRALAR